MQPNLIVSREEWIAARKEHLAKEKELTRLRDQTADELGDKHAAIFNSHLDILDNITLRPDIERRLNEEKLNVEYLLERGSRFIPWKPG